MTKIYRIDVSQKSVTAEDAPQTYRYLGGRGLSAAILAKEIDAQDCWWDPCSMFGRLSVAKKPRRNDQESNSGPGARISHS
jgi:aldehyde:ferredoxin oxidoreductase